MPISESEQERFDRARRRLDGAKLDDMALESTYTALSLSESALTKSPPEMRPAVEAICGLALAFSHFAAGADRSVSAQVAAHVEACKAERLKLAKELKSGSFFSDSKKTLLAAPMWLTVYLSIVSVVGMILFREQFIKIIFS